MTRIHLIIHYFFVTTVGFCLHWVQLLTSVLSSQSEMIGLVLNVSDSIWKIGFK